MAECLFPFFFLGVGKRGTMTKVILILILLGLQNPIPASGASESQPPENQPSSEQGTAKAADTQTNTPLIVLDNGSPNGQQGADDAAKKSDSKAPQYWWTTSEWITIWVALLMVAVGVAQFIMYLCQWRIMRQAFRHSSFSSRQAMRHARESSERSLRAYLGIINPNAENVRLNAREQRGIIPSTYQVTIKNGGQTPAYNVRTCIAWEAVANVSVIPHFPITKGHMEVRRSSDTLVAREEIPDTHVLENHEDGSSFATKFNEVQNGTGVLFLYVLITYDDVYGKHHFTRMCIAAMTIHSSIRFATYDRYNDAD